MSLQLKIEVEELIKSFLIFDCTGNYSGDNKGGYGIPNTRKEDIQSYILFVQPPSATTQYPYSIDLTGKLPNTNKTGVEIFPSQVSEGKDYIESGKWKFRIDITSKVGTNGSKTVSFFHAEVFINNVSCCIDRKVSTLDGNAMHDDRQMKIIELSNLLESVYGNIDNGLYDEASKTIEYLNEQCKCTSC